MSARPRDRCRLWVAEDRRQRITPKPGRPRYRLRFSPWIGRKTSSAVQLQDWMSEDGLVVALALRPAKAERLVTTLILKHS